MSFLSELQRHFRGELKANEALAQRTSLRSGGAADWLARPEDPEDLRVLLAICAAAEVPVWMLGGGANTLVADEGVAGVVVRLPPWEGEQELDDEGGSFVLGAGSPIAKVPQLMRRHGLGGGEFLAGIPGTLGGATAMNAGTRNGETVQVVEALQLVDAEGVRWIPASDLRWRYRACELPEGSVVASVRVRLRRLDDEGLAASRALMQEDLAYRKGSQPLHLPNSGSVFTNPPGDHAGRLIEAAGLKGLREGGAQISEKHANFIVNLGGARSAEVRSLIERARSEVLSRSNVHLSPEVKFAGRWEAEWAP